MDRYSETLDDKTNAIREHFAARLGERIVAYQTAELFLHGEWCDWPDLPIRLFFADRAVVAVSWSRFDDLFLASDLSLPFEPEDSIVRWVENSVPKISPIVGATLRSVSLGRGQFSLESTEIEIWSRLLIEVDRGWFEIFNALDENGYQFHVERPAGDFKACA